MDFKEHVTLGGSLASLIDHTLLRADATEIEIKTLCAEAIQYCFFSVCINPHWVPFCSKWLAQSSVQVISVVGFPLGATSTEIKVKEARWCVDHGAREIDMVINIGALKSKNDLIAENDIRQVVKSSSHAPVKVIIETSLLTLEEKQRAVHLAREAGAQFIKTSTGFSSAGATIEDIRLIKSWVGNTMKIKASGGIRHREEAESFIAAGANRLGTSSGPKIMQNQTPISAQY